MPLIVRGGKLIIGSDGKLTTNQDCCCECVCDVLDPIPYCNCLNAAYEPASASGTLKTAEVTITGSPSPKPRSSSLGTNCGQDLPAPANCNSLAGTYVIDCDERLNWYVWTYVGTETIFSGSWDVYYVQHVQLTYLRQGGISAGVEVTFHHEVWRADAPSTTPWTSPQMWSDPGGTFERCFFVIGSRCEMSYAYSMPTMQRWVYLIGGDCTSECNEEESHWSCVSGEKAWTTSGPCVDGVLTEDCCSAEPYTVELEFV